MRIALTADPELPVPPRLYGGIERIVDLLARGLSARGHAVTLFAHPDSASAGRLAPWPGRRSANATDTARNAGALAREVLGDRFDLVHSFSRIAYLAPILPLPIPKLMTYQREVTARSVALGHSLSRGTLGFTAISRRMMRDVSQIGAWTLVYNAVDLGTYAFVDEAAADAPLVFLGRVEPIKGPHLAIEIAKRTGSRLIIAGNIPDGARPFFEAAVAPHVDGEQITYVGPVDDRQKSALLGAARALLMPITWEEPFGIVMAEAMACGTPVLALARGAAPEVMADGVTGYVRQTVHELAEAVSGILALSRLECRRRTQALFSETAMVEGYLAVYRAMIDRRGARGDRRAENAVAEPAG